MRPKQTLHDLRRRHAFDQAQFVQKSFHHSCRLERDNQLPLSFAHMGPDMRYRPRGKHRIPRLQLVPLVADFEHIFSLQDVEKLLLLVMVVARRPTPVVIRMLEEEEAPVRILPGDLKVDGKPAQHAPTPAEAILSIRDEDRLSFILFHFAWYRSIWLPRRQKKGFRGFYCKHTPP